MEEKPVEVNIIKGGPVHIKGHFLFKDSSGHIEIKEQDLYFCRCGKSSNMPFCDCTHQNNGDGR